MPEMMPLNIDRRTFAKVLGGASVLAASGMGLSVYSDTAYGEPPAGFPEQKTGKPLEASVDLKTKELTINEDVLVRYSGCVGCYSSCGNRVRLDRATQQIITVGGNPYNPNCAYPYLNFDEPLTEAYLSMSYVGKKGNTTRGTVCGRGQATFDAYSQPDRITVPLKRAGARGEGKWKPITWEQLIKEVTEGGKLFSDLGEDQEIEGFVALHDPNTPLDPDAPELGPVSNQLVMLGGRGDGRTAVGGRFISSFGSINAHGHGSSCGGAKNVNVYKTSKLDLRPDCENCEYILWNGCFPGSNGKSMQGIARRVADTLSRGKAIMDVVDPALGNGCVTPSQKNVRWLPIKSATNTAFALGLIRWMIENKAYNAQFLAFPNYKAAFAAGYASFSDASHLVIVDEAHKNYRKLMRAADAGLEEPTPDPQAKTKPTYYVVMDGATGQPAIHAASSAGAIDFEGEVNGVKVRSAFLFLKDSAMEKSIEEWSSICEVPVKEIERIAKEFTSHGTKVSATGMGSTATINGLDSACMYHVLNAMVGSDQMMGGMTARRVSGVTLADGSQYLLSTIKGKPKVKTPDNATYISRTGRLFESTSEYKKAVAAGTANPTPRLPWYSLPGSSDNQALVSIANEYPYRAKILISWMVNTLQATPGAMRDELIDRLKDTKVVPLHIACDVVMGEHANLADYFVPDTTPYESWGVVTQEGYWAGKGNTVRWPVTEPPTELLADGRHASWEAFIADVGRICQLPGFGDAAFSAKDGTTYPFNDACDFFLKGVANLAYTNPPVPDITDEEIKMQALDKLPESWQKSVSKEEWPKVLRVLSRGGRFWPIEEAFDEKGRSAYAQEFMDNIYFEKRALNTNSTTYDHSSGTMRWTPELFNDLTPMEEIYKKEEWPLKSTNYKPRFRSISMLANSPIMRDICAENYLEINCDDAAALDIKDGDTIEISNPTGDVMRGKAMVRAGIAKNTFAVAFGYGHIAYGAQDLEIDGKKTAGNPAIGAGIHLQNQLDPTVKDAIFPIADPEAGTPGRCGGFFKIVKA